MFFFFFLLPNLIPDKPILSYRLHKSNGPGNSWGKKKRLWVEQPGSVSNVDIARHKRLGVFGEMAHSRTRLGTA